MKQWLAVFGGGALGGLARYGVSSVMPAAHGLAATTTVNLVGSFLLAFITFGLARRVDLPDWLILALGTGFVGAFTTCSTLTLEVVTWHALVWLIGDVTLGLAAAGLGLWTANKVVPTWSR
ncbi:fluoride efflux transporter FluC [Lacticaseibacillus sp. GG6-2]